MTTYAECNTAEVATITADTETELLSTTIPSGKGGRIRKILYTWIQAASTSGFIELKLGSHAGPFRFAVAREENTTRVQGVIDVDIEVFANESVKIYATLEVGGTDAHAGIIWIAS